MDQGYDDTRFQNDVHKSFNCPICMNVLKEAMQCRKNEHYFCSPCIRRHLGQNSQRCPLCADDLTIETLRRAPRQVTDYLSSLKISCDHADRGCPEIIELGVLEAHVANCNFFPVRCSNDGCLKVLDKQDVEHHEIKACVFKKVKCDDCDEHFPRSKYNVHGCVMRKEMVEMKCLHVQMLKEVKGISTEVKTMRKEMKRMTTEVNSVKQGKDIIAVGGHDEKPVACVERFSLLDKKWTPLQQMKENRSAAAAVVLENQILVCGGKSVAGFGTDSIEVMDMNQNPEQWLDFPAKLPLKCRGHKCVIYRKRLVVIGGYTNEGEATDGIYEVLLIPPYASKLLCCMKQKRCYHGVELFDDKILIVGGQTSLEPKDSLCEVEMYDLTKNECREMPPLAFALCRMATVAWDDNVILIGGIEDNVASNTVIAYDVNTGESKVLPSMKYDREGCEAVVLGNKIVVMGGFREGENLCSVECFDILSHSWNVLPSMINRRYFITAV